MRQRQKRGEKLFLRTISIFVLTAFFGTNLAVGEPSAVSLNSGPISEVSPDVSIEIPQDLGTLQIPQDLGTVRDRVSSGRQGRVVLHIQDAHGSYEAQVKIKKLLHHLVDHYGASLVLVEGASRPLDPELFRIFKDQNLNIKIADSLAKEGELSGAELYLVEAENPVHTEGMEDAQTYIDNLLMFRNMAEKRAQIESWIAKLRAQIETTGFRKLNKPLREFLRNWQLWREERMSLIDFLSVIHNASEKHLQFDLSHAKMQFDYPMLVRYFKLKNFEAGIDLEKAEIERSELVSFLKTNQISADIIDRIASWKFQNGLADWAGEVPRRFLERLFEEASPHGFQFERYPALVSLWASLVFQSELESDLFFNEIEKINDQLFNALASEAEEKELISIFHNSVLLEKLLLLELTRDEYGAVLKQPDEYDPDRIWQRLIRIIVKGQSFKPDQSEVSELWQMEEFKKQCLRFYETALKREDFFTARADEWFGEHKTGPIILITGGFHSNGLKNQFAQRGYTFYEIAPHLSSVDGIDKIYLQATLERSQIRQLARFEIGGPIFEKVADRVFRARKLEQVFTDVVDPSLVGPFNERNQLGLHATITGGRWSLSVQNLPVRSEVRKKSWVESHVPELSEYTVISRQIEAGLHEGILQRIEEGYDEKAVAAWVAQTVLTGGLGALMGDDFEAQALNGTDIIGINVINEKIKGQKYVRTGRNKKLFEEINLGDILRDVLRKTNHHFEFKLDINDAFQREAEGRGSKAFSVAGQELKAEVYETITKIGKAKLYYLDVFYENAEGARIRIMDESYSDDYLWRDGQIAAYNIASQLLAKQLQEGKEIKEKLIFTDNEVFASLPTPMFPDAIHHHRNHTVFRPGIYMPSEVSYDMLEFPEYLKDDIVQVVDGQRKINIVDAVALTADFITGVGLYEHTPVLGKDILAGHIHKLKGYYSAERGIRSTNGVLLDRWQAPERRDLINQYMKKFRFISKQLFEKDRFSSDEYDQKLYDLLQQEEHKAAFEEFKLKNEFISALYIGDFLIWLAEAQGNPIWLEDTKAELEKYLNNRNIRVSDWMTAGNLDMKKAVQNLREMIQQAVREDSDERWGWLLNQDNLAGEHFRFLVEALIEVPIFSNVRRQVPYKGPEKWSEFLIRKPALEVLGEKSPDEVVSLLESLRDDPSVKNKEGLNALINDIKSATQMSLIPKLSNGFDIWKNAFVYSDRFQSIRDESSRTEAITELKNQKWRKVNGGRVFSEEADLDFESIKRLIKILGLEHHVATIENYSNYEAPIIFRAMAATVMLSDEFLEASATSMMKGLTNFGALIIVWGGAGPELLHIVDKSGQAVDVLKKNIVDQNGQIIDLKKIKVPQKELQEKLRNGTWQIMKVTYEILQANIRSGNWRITNGWLVDYSETEMSRERGGGRRPSVASLYAIVRALSNVYRDPASRRTLQFNALATSPRVNMKTSQARANLYLWSMAIRRRRVERQLFERLKIDPKDVVKILTSDQIKGFLWLRKHDVGRDATILVQKSKDGFFGFVEGFRHLRVKGTEAFWSMAYHAHNNDIFSYLLNDIFVENLYSFSPIRKKLKKLERKALKAIQIKDDYNAVRFNLEALEIVDRFALQISLELFHEFEGSKKRNFAWNIFQENEYAIDNLIRYLDLHAMPLDSSSQSVHVYAIPGRFPPTAVAINESVFQYPKAWTELSGSRSFKNLLGDLNPGVVFQVSDSAGKKYKAYSIAQLLRQGLNIGIPETNLQILYFEASSKKVGGPISEIKPSGEALVDYVNAAAEGILIDDQDLPEKRLREYIVELRKNPDELRATLGRIASFDLGRLREEVKVETLPALMTLITVLSPDLLGSLEKWESEIYNPYYQEQYDHLPTVSVFQRLQSLVRDPGTLAILQQSDFDFHHLDNEKAIVFSKSSNSRRIFVAVHLAKTPFRPQDGKGWFQILHMANLGIERDQNYKIRNHLLNYDYATVHSGQKWLDDNWHIGVPIERRGEELEGEIIEAPLHVQVLEIVKISERPGEDKGNVRSEVRRLPFQSDKPTGADEGGKSRSELRVSNVIPVLSHVTGWIADRDWLNQPGSRELVMTQLNQLVPAISEAVYFSPQLISAYQSYAGALADILGKTPSVVLSAGLEKRDQSLASYLADLEIVRAILKMSPHIEIYVPEAKPSFRNRLEQIIKKLTATEKGLFSGIFHFSPESFFIIATQQGKKGSGVLVADSMDQLAKLDKNLAVLVADLKDLKPKEVRELVVPILIATAVLGALTNGKKLSADQIKRVQAQYAKQLDKLGIELIIQDDGRLVGRLLIQKIREWLMQHRSEQRIQQAA